MFLDLQNQNRKIHKLFLCSSQKWAGAFRRHCARRSFSGQGVKINITRDDLEAVDNPSNYILQRKVQYIAAIDTIIPNEPSKCEIRMMLIWESPNTRPRVVHNLARISKGKMIGVRYNADFSWVGSSTCFFE